MAIDIYFLVVDRPTCISSNIENDVFPTSSNIIFFFLIAKEAFGRNRSKCPRQKEPRRNVRYFAFYRDCLSYTFPDLYHKSTELHSRPGMSLAVYDYVYRGEFPET